MINANLVLGKIETLPEDPKDFVLPIPSVEVPKVLESAEHQYYLDYDYADIIIPEIEDFDYGTLPMREVFIKSFDYEDDLLLTTSSFNRYARREEIREQLDRGVLPALGNGFSFIEDTRPDGHEDDVVPPKEYTRYLKNRQIPIAAKGHRLRLHDVDHVASYQNALAKILVADLVVLAAKKADDGGTDELYEEFTTAFDNFGNSARNLEDHPHVGDIYSMENSLRRLINLAHGDSESKEEVFKKVWVLLDMPYYENLAEITRKNSNRGYQRVLAKSVLGNLALARENTETAT